MTLPADFPVVDYAWIYSKAEYKSKANIQHITAMHNN